MDATDHAEDLAKKLVGNWKKFESFGWHDAPEDADQWAIVYTHNRDSDALARSNAHVIGEAMAPFLTGEDDADAMSEHHGHWACGWIDGYAIRVRNAEGALTSAFLAYAELHASMADYPVLDETHFSETEEKEAEETWRACYRDAERLDYIRKHRSQFEFRSFADLLGCVRGKFFAGYASELLS